MIKFPVTIVCDNSGCMNEAAAHIVMEGRSYSTNPNSGTPFYGLALEFVADNLPLNPPWRHVVESAIACSLQCANAIRRQIGLPEMKDQ